MLRVGIVGLPNVGKSTLFNALTTGHAAVSNYPFTTIEPNVGVVPVPDPRLDQLTHFYQPETVTPCTIQFIDIAGLVQGADHADMRPTARRAAAESQTDSGFHRVLGAHCAKRSCSSQSVTVTVANAPTSR